MFISSTTDNKLPTVAILAGGLAMRMKDSGEIGPKALFTIYDRPFLWYILNNLQKQGVSKVVLLIGHLGEMIRDYVESQDWSGLKCYFVQEEKNKLFQKKEKS